MKRKVLQIALAFDCLLLIVLAAAFYWRLWPLEVLVSFTPQILLISLLIFLLFLGACPRLSGRVWSSSRRLLVLLIVVGLAAGLYCAYLSVTVQPVAKPQAAAGQSFIKYATFNKLYSNRDNQTAANYLANQQVDIVGLQEILPSEVKEMGHTLKKQQAQFAQPPRIVFLGLLEGYWINLPLLAKLCKLYPHIDVYGGPPPPKDLGIPYKGYAPDLSVLSQYQFGLITISDDALRQHSFSSKQLEYMSYGLPVLTPDWRFDKVLKDSSVYYNESDFLDKIAHYSDRQRWQALSRQAQQTAKQLSWDQALKDLDKIVK